MHEVRINHVDDDAKIMKVLQLMAIFLVILSGGAWEKIKIDCEKFLSSCWKESSSIKKEFDNILWFFM